MAAALPFPVRPGSRILLVEPPFYRFFGYERWHYPVTLTLLATELERRGYPTRVYDADKPTGDCRPLSRFEVIDRYGRYEEALRNDDHPIWHEVRRTLEDFRPDVIGLTSITAKIDSTNRIAAMARKMFGGAVTIVLGGSHVNGMSVTEPGHDFGDPYDHVVRDIPGLVRLKPDRTLILDHHSYSAANLSGIMTSTGCPNACTFCCHSFQKTMAYRDIESIRLELAEIRERFGGSAPVYIMDDCLFSNGTHFRKVVSALEASRLSFTAGSRIMALSQEKIERFVEGGGIRILVGVESGSQTVLDRIRKRLRLEEVVRRTRWLTDAGVPWSAFFIVGFPFETLDDLKRTEELIHRIRPDFVSINRFTPYPGTEIYNEYYRHEKIPFRRLFQLSRESCVRLGEEMENRIEDLFLSFDRYNAEPTRKCRSGLG